MGKVGGRPFGHWSFRHILFWCVCVCATGGGIKVVQGFFTFWCLRQTHPVVYLNTFRAPYQEQARTPKFRNRLPKIPLSQTHKHRSTHRFSLNSHPWRYLQVRYRKSHNDLHQQTNMLSGSTNMIRQELE